MKMKHKLYISIHRHPFLIPYTRTHNASSNTTPHHTHITHAINSCIIHTHHIHYLHITHMYTHATHIIGTHAYHTQTHSSPLTSYITHTETYKSHTHVTYTHTHTSHTCTHIWHTSWAHTYITHTFIPSDIIYYTQRGIYITNSYHISTYIITHIPSHVPLSRRCLQGKRIPLHLKKDPGKQKQRMKWARIQVT